jgi:hypothetical protein
MDSGPVERAGRAPVPYRIVVRGQLTERFTEPLEGVVIESAGARSVLRVEVVDQAKLQGILGWLYEHGVDLVSLAPVVDAAGDGVSPVVKR